MRFTTFSTSWLVTMPYRSSFSPGPVRTSVPGPMSEAIRENVKAIRSTACVPSAGPARRCFTMPKPTIARIDGVAAGAGLNMALACDLVVATDRSRFSEIFARRGLSIDFGGSFILPRIVGMQRAKELVLLADVIDASRAAEMGLVNRVVARDDLDTVVDEFATKLMAASIALATSKKLLNQSFTSTLDEALEAEGIGQCVPVHDRRCGRGDEGVRRETRSELRGPLRLSLRAVAELARVRR